MQSQSIIRFVRGSVLCPDGPRQASVLVRNGIIEALDSPLPCGGLDIDIEGLWLLPGAIDGHVHFDEPGFTEREDFASGTQAAAAGGVTTVVDMPCTSLPPVTSGASFDNKLQVIRNKAYVDFQFWGGVRGNQFNVSTLATNLDELASRGVRSIKCYLISGMDTFTDLTHKQLFRVMMEARKRDLLVGVHAEDKRMIEQQTALAKACADAMLPRAYARARNAQAEAKGVQTCMQLAQETGAQVHVVHLACELGLQQVREAKRAGAKVSCETCPHYLAFTIAELERLAGLLKTAPVVKTSADREALWQGLADGSIDMIATDHAPGSFPREKTTGSIWTDYGGVPGVELMLSYVMSEGVAKGRITASRAIELICSNPARIHRLRAKGHVQPGYDADLVVFDPNESWVVDPLQLFTRQKYTPMQSMRLTGKVKRTYLRGMLVYDSQKGIMGNARGRRVISG